jgi:streptolysin S family bacteriocin protoxin
MLAAQATSRDFPRRWFMFGLRMKFASALAVGAMLAVSQAKAADPVLPTQPKPTTHVTVGDPGCCGCCDDCCQNIRAWGELMYISPRNLNLAFAVPVDGCVTLNPVGAVSQVSPDDSFTFRVGLEYAVNCNTSVGVSYTRLHNEEETAVEAPPGSILQSLVTIVGDGCVEDSTTQLAGARYSLEYDIIDIDVRNVLYSCNNVNIVWLIGGRIMRYEQDFASQFTTLTDTFVTSNVSLDLGYGPRVGLEGEIGLTCGWSAYAKTAVTFLYGSIDASYLQFNSAAGVQATTSFKQERVMTILDFEAGLAWTNCDGSIRVAAGFLVSQWYNALTVPGVIDSLRAGNFNRHEDSLNDLIQIEGGVLRVEFRF